MTYGEFLGYENLGQLELQNEPWQFYLVGLWRKDGKYYVGTDSGCSCPIPFESYRVEDLTGPMDRNEAVDCVLDLIDAETKSEYYQGPVNEEVVEFMRQIV